MDKNTYREKVCDNFLEYTKEYIINMLSQNNAVYYDSVRNFPVNDTSYLSILIKDDIITVITVNEQGYEIIFGTTACKDLATNFDIIMDDIYKTFSGDLISSDDLINCIEHVIGSHPIPTKN